MGRKKDRVNLVSETALEARWLWEQNAANAYQVPDQQVLDMIEEIRNLRLQLAQLNKSPVV